MPKNESLRIRQRSALNPFLYLTGMCLAAGAGLFRFAGPSGELIGAYLMLVPATVTLGIGAFFAAKDRDRLQGEDYLAQRYSIRAIESMSGVIKDPLSLVNTLNPDPEIPRIPSGGNDSASDLADEKNEGAGS